MNPLESKKSYLTAPVLALLGLISILLLWGITDPCVSIEWSDTENALFSPVAWSAATFGLVSVFVLTIDRLSANLRGWGIVDLKEPGHEAGLALCKGLEEGSEMIMALLALLTLLQSYLIFGRHAATDQDQSRT